VLSTALFRSHVPTSGALTRPGGAASPLIYPGNSPPRWTPALQLLKEGYTVVMAAKMAIFLPRQNFSSRVPRFPGFASFPWCALVFSPYRLDRTCPLHVFSVFARLARFRPFWPFCQVLLFRLVISQYPGDRTCTFHVFSVSPDLHVFARFGRVDSFC
jgi:hypothetical protein